MYEVSPEGLQRMDCCNEIEDFINYELSNSKNISRVCVKGSTFNKFKIDYFRKLEEVIELQYHNEHNRVFLFKCYLYDTIDIEIRVDHHHGLVEINTKDRFRNVDYVFVFVKECQQVYYTYIPSFIKDYSRVDWLSVPKTKSRGHVQVVRDGNDEVTAGDDVFQINKLVDAYWVTLSTDLDKNSNFCVYENIFIDIDARDLNDILRTNGHTKFNKDDEINELQFNEEDYDEHDIDEIKEE